MTADETSISARRFGPAGYRVAFPAFDGPHVRAFVRWRRHLWAVAADGAPGPTVFAGRADADAAAEQACLAHFGAPCVGGYGLTLIASGTQVAGAETAAGIEYEEAGR